MPPSDPSDPRAPTPERDRYEPDESDLGEPDPDAQNLDALRQRQDVAGLLALAKAHRAGTAPGGRDMRACLEAYRAAAELGNAEAEYAVALFSMNGGTVVAQDLKEGTTRLRSAAEKGSVPAKVYLGNLYELGIHYKADAEKADVWYRNAARGAHVHAEAGSDEWTRALADLGCARHVLLLTRDPSLDESEKTRLLARAKAHGYGLRIRDELTESGGDRATFVEALAGAERPALTGTPPPVAVDLALAPRERKDTSPETKRAKQLVEERTRAKEVPASAPAPTVDPRAAAAARRRSAERRARWRAALGAFGYALLFAMAGVGAGYAATLGGRELVARGHLLPLVGSNVRLVFPIVLGAVGVLPTWLVYKLGTVLKSLVLGAVVGGIGWVAWGTGRAAYHPDRPLQALAFALAGFLAALLVFGLLGGAKQPRPMRARRDA